MRSTLIILLFCLSMISCAKRQPFYDLYTHPQFQESAKLYLDLPESVHISLFSDEQCTLGKHGTRVEYDHFTGEPEVEGYRPKYASMGKLPSINTEAGTPHIINFTREEKTVSQYDKTSLSKICSLTYYFIPQADHNYAAVYEYKQNKCRAIVFDLTESRAANKLVAANALRPAERNCDIFEYYSEHPR